MTLTHTHKFSLASTALLAAVLFGASTPAAKWLIGSINPQLLAGLFYLGSGVGLLIWNVFARSLQSNKQEASLRMADLPWLASAILFGGVLAPLLLMLGLTSTTGGAASLLLNLEALFTALLARFAFKEYFDRRIFVGMLAIVAGSIVLSWQTGASIGLSVGSLAITAACFCWGVDNNLTRKVSHADPVQIASAKGLIAGLVNCGIALAFAPGQSASNLPAISAVAMALLVGFFGYGLSLVLYIKALRHLGAARTGAYFSISPFAGAILSVLFLHESISAKLIVAACFMAFGVWLHLSESHVHEHSHAEQEHEHMHVHDEHHQHEHNEDDPVGEPHSHWHRHVAITHSHLHYPDLHHHHDHE